MLVVDDHAVVLQMIADTLARVGSANLNNRSGGFDTELELAIEQMRLTKSQLPEDEYYLKLEGLLLEMGRLYEQARPVVQ